MRKWKIKERDAKAPHPYALYLKFKLATHDFFKWSMLLM